MEVSMICTEMLPVPPVLGGAIQQYIWGICSILASRYDISVICRDDPVLPDHEVLKGVEFTRVPARSRRHYLDQVVASLRNRDTELIHIFNRPEWVLPLREEFPGTRLILSLHNEMMAEGKISVEKGEECIEALDAINTVSQYVASRLVQRFPQAAPKVRTVYSGADTGHFKPGWAPGGARDREETRLALGLPDRRVILYSNRINAKKGTHLLIQAASELAASHPDVALLVLGSKWYGKDEKDGYVERIHAMAGEAPVPVILTGFVKPQEIHRYYAAADIFACASQWSEPLSRTHYEAMASGLPIVTTARGGNPEVVRGYGCGIVLDDYNSVSAWVHALGYLLGDPGLMREMGKTGRRLALERYSWRRVASDVSQMYEEVMPEPRPSQATGEDRAKVLQERSLEHRSL
ncbi:MAG: glycosyltransferase family 4 protein [Bacillota bacterium]